MSEHARAIIGRRGVLAGAGGLLASPAIVRAQGQGNGVALVIGNSKYQWETSLPNVKRDVVDIARRFEQLGLKTELVQDASHATMKQAVEKFADSARGANLAAFYFAGHGAQWDKDSYIVPVDVDLGTPSVVKSLQSVSSIRTAVKDAAHRFLVFDACRNNPADDWRQKWAIDQALVWRGVEAKNANTLLLFSTAPGRIALDGPPGQNSPFAAALLRQLVGPSMDLQALPANLRRDLLIATESRQVLWDNNTYKEPFVVNGAAGTAATKPPILGGDSARLVELPNAYTFARQHNLPMPPGLVAHRPRAMSSAGRAIGSFWYSHGDYKEAMVVVLSVDDPQAVELLSITRHKAMQSFWRFTRGTMSNEALEWTSTNRYALKWRNADSGTISIELLDPTQPQQGKFFLWPFTRLDG